MTISRTLAARYFDLLRAEGYRPRMDRSDDQHTSIPFKSEGQTFVLFVDEEDEAFFHLGIAYDLGPEWEPGAALARANDLSFELKVVKVTVHPEEKAVRFHVEAFLDRPATLAILERSIAALRNGVRQFFAQERDRQRLDA